MKQKSKSSKSKVKFRQAGSCFSRVLQSAKLAYATKTKESINSQKFWRIVNSVLEKVPEVLSSASDKAKLFAKNFSINSHLDD